MKKIIALLLVSLLAITSCASQTDEANEPATEAEEAVVVQEEETPADFEGVDLDDPELLQYVQDNVYATLEEELDSDDYVVENVQAVYVSKEYLEELEYNSKSNIYFGFTLDEIEKQFSGERYVFTLGGDGQTIVKQFEPYDDTNERLLKNVAIGTGIILICVTVSVATGGAGLPAVSMVFATSAKTGAVMAVSSGGIGGVAAGVSTGVKTGDMKQATKAAKDAAGEGFKWGAITGVVAGGASEVITMKNAGAAANAASKSNVPTPRESELTALEKFGGEEQVSYLNGERVPFGTQNATRPDVVRETKNGLEAIEVKNYNLANSSNRNTLYKELERQVTARVENMPEGTLQRVVLDTRNREFSKELIDLTKQGIQSRCATVYPNLPITVLH